MQSQTDALLNERETTHGSFADNARISQSLKASFRACPAWDDMPAVHRESLDMIAMKLSRILSGKSETQHWEDLCGYGQLVLKDIAAHER